MFYEDFSETLRCVSLDILGNSLLYIKVVSSHIKKPTSEELQLCGVGQVDHSDKTDMKEINGGPSSAH